MQDWIVTTLKSVQLYAAENGFTKLAEEMNVAILIAADERHARDLTGVIDSDEPGAGQHREKNVVDLGPFRARRAH